MTSVTGDLDPRARVTIRPMERGDASAIARLSGELGYPATVDQVRVRFERVRESAESQPAALFSARDDASGEIVGWVHVLVPVLMEQDGVAEIWGLVVAGSHRQRGIGSLLMARAEAWAIEQGCTTMRLRSSLHREAAHAFYRRLGYQIAKTQLSFTRPLAPDSSDSSPSDDDRVGP